MINEKDPFIECNDIAPWEQNCIPYHIDTKTMIEEVKEELNFLEKVIDRYIKK